MGIGHLYAGIALFILFLGMDAVLYAFSSALSGVNPAKTDRLAAAGDRRAIKLLRLMEEQNRFGDTLDIVVFITDIVAGGYILRAAGGRLEQGIGAKTPWVSIAAGAVMIFLFLVFGVLIPKKCGRKNPDKTAYAFIGAARFFMVLLTPVAYLTSFISDLILKIFGINPKQTGENVTEEAVITMVNEGQEQGVFEACEAEMIANIFELNNKHASDVMTHRSNITALDAEQTLGEVVAKQLDGPFSRFPVYDEDIDNIIGTLHIRDAIILYRNPGNRSKKISAVRGLLRPAYFVPETRDLDDLLKEMQAEKNHMGIVVDEYGQTSGIITLEDIIEEIVGNILDEYDEEKPEITVREDDSCVVDGLMQLEELEKLLGTKIERDGYDTLNGLLISKLNRIPQEKETLEDIVCGDLCFRIMEVAQNVIRKVEITKFFAKPETENENPV